MYKKEFNKWNDLKKKINDIQREVFIRSGEIRWSILGVNIGSEMDGKGNSFTRPTLILHVIGKKLALVAPLSTQIKKTPGYFILDWKNKKNAICINQVRVISQNRVLKRVGRISEKKLRVVKDELIKFNNFEIPNVKAMCLFTHKNKTLVSKGYDKVKNEYFYRVLGGHAEFTETSENCIRREIREELGCEIENLKLEDVIENIFEFEGINGHEIVFLYKGDLSNKDLYDKEKIQIIEPYKEFCAEWVLIEDILSNKIPLYPKTNYSEIFSKIK